MPLINVNVTETIANTTRGIVMGIVRDLMGFTGISSKSQILYNGDIDAAMQPGSDGNQKKNVNTEPYNERVTVKVDDNYDMDRLLTTAIFKTENIPFFMDKDIGIYIKPVYAATELIINFEYRAADKTSAERWRDNIRAKIAMNWDNRMYSIAYHYLIPKECLVILKELHRMRENVAPYGETYDQYIQNHFSKKVTVFNTSSGSSRAWGIEEIQERVMGYFDFDTTPEKGSREDESDTWTINFTYKIKYDKPITCEMQYPLVVHNQLVDYKFRPDSAVDGPNPLKGKKFSAPLSAYQFSFFDKTNINYRTMPGISIPDFDEFIPASVLNKTIRVFTAMVTIDPLNPHLLFNFNDLNSTSMYLHPAVLRFMAGEAQYMTSYSKSIFNVSLYRGIDLCDSSAISVDANLNIIAANQLSLRDQFHVRFSITTDLNLLTPEAIDRLRMNSDALNVILLYLDGSLLEKNLLPPTLGSVKTVTSGPATAGDLTLASNNNGVYVNYQYVTGANGTTVIISTTTLADGITVVETYSPGNNYVTRAALNLAINEMNRGRISYGNYQDYQRNTVGIYRIIAAHLNK